LGDLITKDEISRTGNIVCMVGKMHGSFGVENPMKTNHLGDLHTDGKIIHSVVSLMTGP
jgi:hypothetical protein